MLHYPSKRLIIVGPKTGMQRMVSTLQIQLREYKHFGRERAAEGELRRPPGARRGIPRAE
ncbi:hypothetical protein C4D60_Mb09t18900 [Musa balbisiana]|uniref:Uncharacterized protein n=1 Tax=Musa balbisiana TaxID=52838 RepID=A0A4S8IHE8_MUSBA|nr:hypothetical protein C4D60_Mb09t18900 [Musa balbisiana]